MKFREFYKSLMAGKICIVVLLLALGIALSGCDGCTGGGRRSSSRSDSQPITGARGYVKDVVNGNTIVFNTGLKVKLRGVLPSEAGKRFLEDNVKGKRVSLVADSHDPVQTYKRGSRGPINAYVVVNGDELLNSVNGRMVRIGVAKYDVTIRSDSVFERLGPEVVELTSAELLAKLNPATFSIMIPGENKLGTGFYISSKGIAVTNAHVINEQNWCDARIVAFTRDGKYDENNYRTVNRVLYSGSDQDIATDYTIFEVNMNGFETAFVPLAMKKEQDGVKVFKLGCQLGEPAHLADGLLSSTTDGKITHSININHGDSGSPLVNVYGQAIGINQGGRLENELTGSASAVNYAVDIQTIRQWLEAHPDSKEGVLYGR